MTPRPASAPRYLLLGLFALVAPAASVAAQPPVAAPAPAAPAPASAVAPELLLNPRDPLPGVRTGGLTPASELFAALAEEGFATLVDLRTDQEQPEAARAGAEAAGLRYVRIPIGSDADLDLGAARALDAVLDEPAARPAVVACASGNRSGALLALRAFWLDGRPAEEALALGKAAGLTRLEPSVRQLLGLPPLPPAPVN